MDENPKSKAVPELNLQTSLLSTARPPPLHLAVAQRTEKRAMVEEVEIEGFRRKIVKVHGWRRSKRIGKALTAGDDRMTMTPKRVRPLPQGTEATLHRQHRSPAPQWKTASSADAGEIPPPRNYPGLEASEGPSFERFVWKRNPQIAKKGSNLRRTFAFGGVSSGSDSSQ